MSFLCKPCSFLTHKKYNFDKHLLSKRHLTRCPTAKPIENQLLTQSKVNDSVAAAPLLFPCKYCNKNFTFKQSMYHHIKYVCKENKDEDLKELVRLLNSRLGILEKSYKDDKLLNTKQLANQDKNIEKLKSKLEISGSFNTTNNIQNIHLLPYRETDTSHLTDKDYRECFNHRNHCVKHMIEKVHFNPSKPENMNIHISNMKDKYIMIYDGFQWNIADRKREIDYLYDEKEMMLEDWLESNPDKVLRDKFMKYLNNKEDDECLNQIKEDIKMMLYNKQTLYKQLTE